MSQNGSSPRGHSSWTPLLPLSTPTAAPRGAQRPALVFGVALIVAIAGGNVLALKTSTNYFIVSLAGADLLLALLVLPLYVHAEVRRTRGRGGDTGGQWVLVPGPFSGVFPHQKDQDPGMPEWDQLSSWSGARTVPSDPEPFSDVARLSVTYVVRTRLLTKTEIQKHDGC
ncbi:hypothetical protein WMY93_006230 [Mugilogobius chulae]|uniref:Uncharacterized protein n=1 Tax=Mugilogobius chulae TaxID=88201 RepID=A0AAW0PJ23_9GOBI